MGCCEQIADVVATVLWHVSLGCLSYDEVGTVLKLSAFPVSVQDSFVIIYLQGHVKDPWNVWSCKSRQWASFCIFCTRQLQESIRNALPFKFKTPWDDPETPKMILRWHIYSCYHLELFFVWSWYWPPFQKRIKPVTVSPSCGLNLFLC